MQLMLEKQRRIMVLQAAVQLFLAAVTERGMAQIMAKRDRLDQVQVQPSTRPMVPAM
jgi:hypothetical protein